MDGFVHALNLHDLPINYYRKELQKRLIWGECLNNVLTMSENMSYLCPLVRLQALSKEFLLTVSPSADYLKTVSE